MLVACRFHWDKGKIQNKVLTTGVNKALCSKTFTNGGLSASLGNFLMISLLPIYKPKDKWNLLSAQMYNCTTGVPTAMGVLNSNNCNLNFTGCRVFIWSWGPESQTRLITAIVHLLVKILLVRLQRVWETVLLIWSHKSVYKIDKALMKFVLRLSQT